MIHADTDNFSEKILKSSRPTVTLFYATYCPFARSFDPVFEEYSRDPEYEFAKVDITDDDNPLWERYNIEAVPTLIAFKDGKEIGRKDAALGVGLSEEDLKDLLQEI
ncbi:MAG: thioredoxin family protein [Nitrososphaerales archaeon]